MATLDVGIAVEQAQGGDAHEESRVVEQPADSGRPWARWELLAYAALVLAALSLRLWDLGAQAVHHDESLHAVYSWYLSEGRGYSHNPLMHGPFQFIGTSLLYRIFGDGDAVARVLPALFGTALVGLPMLFRSYLGRIGALATSLLLAFSPTMLYFSRFARNDIYIAVWTLALVAFMWRYMDSRKPRYLVFAAIVFAFLFSTKETSYLLVAILGSYLVLLAAKDVFPWLAARRALRNFSPAGEFLVLMGTLTLPLSGAATSIFQGRLGLTLANGDPNVAAVGIPLGTGLYVAFVLTVLLLLAAVVVGLRWRPKLWLLCFGAFAIVWVLLYTTFFSNILGIGSGMWQSLGYWVQQHEVCRGCQPWYYYFVIGLNYEFLPLLLAVPAMVYYGLKGDRFSRFLVYWAALNFIAYTLAGEKMPWLLVEVALPFILLAGKLLGELLARQPFVSPRVAIAEEGATEPVGESNPGEAAAAEVAVTTEGPRLKVHWVALGFAGMVLLTLAVSGRTLSRVLEPGVSLGTWPNWGLLLLIPALVYACLYLLSLIRRGQRLTLVVLVLAGAMFALSVSGAFRLAYQNNDVPVEMLVYTQTSPDIPVVLADIRRLSEETGKGAELRITVDSTDGFSWPWAWYLRDYRLVGYPCLSNDSGCTGLKEAPESDVVLLAARNQSSASTYLKDYGSPVRYKHRWWFPESYRGLSPGTIGGSVLEREPWRRVVDYFLFRDFPETRLGSVDAFAYFPKDFTPTALQ